MAIIPGMHSSVTYSSLMQAFSMRGYVELIELRPSKSVACSLPTALDALCIVCDAVRAAAFNFFFLEMEDANIIHKLFYDCVNDEISDPLVIPCAVV